MSRKSKSGRQALYSLVVSKSELRERVRNRNVGAPYFLKGSELDIGQVIQLCLELRETSESIILPAEVIWRRRGSRKLSGGVGVVISEEAAVELERWMREVLDEQPGAPPPAQIRMQPAKQAPPASRPPASESLNSPSKQPAAEPEASARPTVRNPVTRDSLPNLRRSGQTILPASYDSGVDNDMMYGGLNVEGQVARNPLPGEYVAARFECMQEIGRGGVGVIYRCRHSVLNKRVALKMLQEELPDKESVGQLFLNEAKILSSLETQHIPAVFDFGVDPHFGPYFVMEHLVGETLAVRMESMDAELDEKEFYDLAINLIVALDAVHKEGVIHCDLKPENIWVAKEHNLLGERGYLKIFDFGIARTLDKPGDKESKTMVAGTPDFMAPEQILGEKLDGRTDLYAVGVIFYQMLTGDVPFPSDDPYEILRSHLETMPTAVRKRRSRPISKRLDALILRLLAKEPVDRYPSAEVVYHSLRFIQGAS